VSVIPPPLCLGGGGVHTRLRERWWGSPNSNEGTDTAVLSIYVLCGPFSLCTVWFGGAGLLARGGAAHVVMSLTHQCPLDLQPFTGKLLSALVGGLSDRNPALRLNFATAIGHLMLTAKDSSREKLFGRLAAWYLEDEASRAAVAFTFQVQLG
jgi:hypothetical protein